MAEETTISTNTEVTEVPAPTESPTPAEVQKPDSHMIPKSRFDEVNQAKKDLEAKLQAYEDAQQKAKEAEMSEFEILKAKFEALNKTVEEKDKALETIQKQRINDVRDSGLLQQLNTAHDPRKVLTLLKAEKPDVVESLVSEDGVFDVEKAQKLVSDYVSENAYLFASTAKGSPSNSGGRSPNPTKNAAEKLTRSISSIINQS
mgnify:CR=1 FL=1